MKKVPTFSLQRQFGLSIGKIVETVLESFKEALFDLYRFPVEYPFVALGFATIGIVVLTAFKLRGGKTGFKLPGLLLVCCICINAVMYMPKLYAGVGVSGGVPNTIFQVYLLTMSVFEIYFLGWINDKTEKLSSKQMVILCGTASVLIVFACLAFKSGIKESTMYMSYEYLSSGQAEDYKAQMEYNKAILLDDNIKECYLCPINDDQGPLMYMPVTEEPDNFTNASTRGFYQKELVVVDSNLVVHK